MKFDNEKFIFNKEVYKCLEEKSSCVFVSNEYLKWFKTTVTGRDILERLDGNKTVVEVIEELTELYELPKNMIYDDVQSFVESAIKFHIIEKKGEEAQGKKEDMSLRVLYLEVTNECPHKCTYCNKTTCTKNFDHMEKELFTEIMTKISKFSNGEKVLINITGGEPLFHPELEYILKTCSDLGHTILLWTTGENMSKSMVTMIDKYCYGVVLPLDSSIEEVNDRIRYPGAYASTIKAIEVLKDISIQTFVATTPLRDNVDELDRILNYVWSLGIAGMILNEPIKKNELDTDIGQYFVDNLSKIQAVKDALLKRVAIINSWENNKLKKDYLQKRKYPFTFIDDVERCMNSPFRTIAKSHCGCGINELTVGVTGKVYPCHNLVNSRFEMGSITEYEQRYVGSISECNNCEYKLFCLGGCRARSYYEEEDINGKNPLCENEKKKTHNILFSNIRPV